MDRKAKARARAEHYQGRILAILESGPMSAMEIATMLHNEISIASTAMHLRAMEGEGKVCRDRWERHPGADLYAIWAVADEQHRKNCIDRTLKVSKGIDNSDIEWMKFWRMPRSERRMVLWGEQ